MMAYKGFNSKLQAVMGRGIFQFKPGETYEESGCKCARNGFHCAENPLCALSYYSGMSSRFFIVEAAGDINQDGIGSRISCTKLTLLKEIDRIRLAVHACIYMQTYPERDIENHRYVKRDNGRCCEEGDFVIVRGRSPWAAGVKGSWLFLVKEAKGSGRIEAVCPVFIDEEEYKADTWYGIRGEKKKKKRD